MVTRWGLQSVFETVLPTARPLELQMGRQTELPSVRQKAFPKAKR